MSNERIRLRPPLDFNQLQISNRFRKSVDIPPNYEIHVADAIRATPVVTEKRISPQPEFDLVQPRS
jgi:hypothetical protein